MIPAHQGLARAIEMIAHRPARNGEIASAVRRAPIMVPSMQQLKEVFAAPDSLTEGEQQACNMATD